MIDTLFLPSIHSIIPLPKEYMFVFKITLHAILIIAMLLTNGLMLRFYVKSMHENGAAKATVYNFAINYLSSVI